MNARSFPAADKAANRYLCISTCSSEMERFLHLGFRDLVRVPWHFQYHAVKAPPLRRRVLGSEAELSCLDRKSHSLGASRFSRPRARFQERRKTVDVRCSKRTTFPFRSR